jgi:zinc transporter 1/2/3
VDDDIKKKEIKNSKHAAIILILTLSIHSFFEGMIVGLMNAVSSSLQTTVAILIHKSCASLSLGGSLKRAHLHGSKTIKKMIILYYSMAPLGCILGNILSNVSPLVDVICISISGGAFIYISCSEIITVEFSKHSHHLSKLAAFLFGAIVTISLWFMVDH